MTPLQLSKAYCANHQTDGSCLGAAFDDKGRITHCCRKPKCALGTSTTRCGYFEECVMPFGQWIANPRQKQEFLEATWQYRKDTGAMSQTRNGRCPDCGKVKEPRHRFCPVCSVRRRKETVKRSKSKTDMSGKQLSHFYTT